MTDKNKIILAIQNVDEVMSLQSQSEDKLKLDFESVKAEHNIKNALINNMADNEKDVVSIMEHLLTENDQLDAEHVKRLRINVKLLEELAVDIFEASHLEQIDDEPDKTGFEIKSLFKTVENFAQVIAGMKEIDFIVDEDFDGVSDTEVYGNMLYVKRILFNIVHNALKYSPAGSEIHCAVELREHGGRLACKYKVSDEGIGIATDFQPHMFDPFTQENRQVDSWGNGQGLGLYVAKQLLDKIGGNIAVYSAVDIGTIVTVNMSFDIV